VTGLSEGVIIVQPPRLDNIVWPRRFSRSTVTRPAIPRFSGSGPGVDVMSGGTAVPGRMVNPLKHGLHITSSQLLAVTVDVVPSIEQPVLVCEQVVLYDVHEELAVVPAHSIRQLETVVVAVQLDLDELDRLDRLVPLSVGELVEDFSRDLVGELVSEISDGSSSEDSSVTGGDVQSPTWIKRSLMQGR